MRVLIDTHVWLWLAMEPERLNSDTLRMLEDAENEALISVASIWEVCIKYGKGQLKLPEPPSQFVPSRLSLYRFNPLPIQLDHLFAVATLPHHHRDPFDRLLIAQALVERLPIVTDDPRFAAYEIEVLKAC